MAAAAWPAELALANLGVPPIAHVVIIGMVGGAAYLIAIRLWFKDAWRDLSAVVRRVLPVRRAQAMFRRLVPVPAGRS
jgi:hypothetical protein